ncbi:hypothetical protein [Streptomyces sp. NBC_00878]|uniref:hypothetical protein n=1 Tax=Streptomyces sp. NBC_00878 TaxID=2975854 RepID=UPI0022548473|nr:hypothetical protein [Streptomyces sp. NBC_00878]MCX4905451.1 hypothetical protein [Streptomyces sp. NBC_00878]
MSTGSVESRAGNAELPMLRAYRLWFEHTKKCADCKDKHKAQDGCETGRERWGTYRLARTGRTP